MSAASLLHSSVLQAINAEIKIVDQACFITQSHHVVIEPVGSSTDATKPGAWQGNHHMTEF